MHLGEIVLVFCSVGLLWRREAIWVLAALQVLWLQRDRAGQAAPDLGGTGVLGNWVGDCRLDLPGYREPLRS